MDIVKEFLVANGLRNGLDHILSTVVNTFESKSNQSRSIIDHICISDDSFHKIMEHSTYQSIENTSDHTALYCQTEVDTCHLEDIDSCFSQKPAWYKASDVNKQHYKDTLDENLGKIKVSNNVITCQDPFCKKHAEEITTFTMQVVNAC